MNELIATRDAYGEALVALGESEEIFVFDADLSCATKTEHFAAKYPERFFQMGIAEQDMMGTAAGTAVMGKTPFVSTFALFATGRAYEQVRNSIAYPNLNVKIAASHSGITVGPDGGSHQSVEDIGLMRLVPNMKVVVPADAYETRKVLEAALEIEGPFYIRLGRNPVPVLFNDDYEYEFGKISTLTDGSDLSIAATGIMVTEALQAAKLLKKDGINVRVLNVHTIKPLDKETIIKAAEETKLIVSVEEHSIIGGLGAAICELLCEQRPTPVVRMGLNDTFGQSGSPEELLEYYGLTADNIVKRVKTVLA
ncbi:transketolase family protein [Halocella sp. SP3-1]|uniref:transketolase family protein n=1 Tax=Halocella sp. SP3-1 TaxID=2382161 RepID=UPI000F7552F6|nr:transketolase family protein [Halocella sp. SP3-1]AZO94373.1 transketolase family protein [Halocella sp. SP3-1]